MAPCRLRQHVFGGGIADLAPLGDVRGSESATTPFWFGYQDEEPEYELPADAVVFAATVRIRISADSLDTRDAWLAFPDSVVAQADGRTRLFLIALREAPSRGIRTTEGPPLTHIFSAEVPDLESVDASLYAWLAPDGNPRAHGSCQDVTYEPGDVEYWQMGCHETPHLPCTARVCDRPEEEGPGSGGDPWPPGSPPPPDGSGGSGGNGDGDCDPNDLNCHEPDPCQEPDPPAHCTNPCVTGNETIDDTSFSEDVDELVKASNWNDPDGNNRLENGGWIVRDPMTGRRSIEPFSGNFIQTPCSIEFPDGHTIPPYAEGMFHTHPFSVGEVEAYFPCRVQQHMNNGMSQEDAETWAGLAQYGYAGTAHRGDIDELNRINNASGLNLYAIFADKDGYVVYDGATPPGQPRDDAESYPVCGYDPDQ
jgi:hypothetical protein